QLEKMPIISNKATAPFRFDMGYDGDGDKSVKHFGIEGELNIRLFELINLGGRLNIGQYTTAQEEEAWHTPKLRLAGNARFNISETLYIDAEVLFHGVSYGKDRDDIRALTGFRKPASGHL